MTTAALERMIARPIAHRGLHDASNGIVENSLSAARAAIAAGYAIECDIQTSRDGELVVFHDDTLERLTAATGPVAAFDASTLTRLQLDGAAETIPTFAGFLATIAGAAPLVVELKSRFDGDTRGAERAAALLAAYDGPVVVESFDPAPIAFLRANADRLGVPDIPLGIVGEAVYDEKDWPTLTAAQRVEMTQFLHFPLTRPDFLSWSVADLPHAIPFLARQALGLPVTTWTVRTPAQAEAAAKWADQIVFETFLPASSKA
jgi:glycerophosphoryl diester phosphodiesterase